VATSTTCTAPDSTAGTTFDLVQSDCAGQYTQGRFRFGILQAPRERFSDRRGAYARAHVSAAHYDGALQRDLGMLALLRNGKLALAGYLERFSTFLDGSLFGHSSTTTSLAGETSIALI
jgi:hypothetical protein